MKKTWKRLCTGFLAFATVVTALPTIPVHAESKQYWTESAERDVYKRQVSITAQMITGFWMWSFTAKSFGRI